MAEFCVGGEGVIRGQKLCEGASILRGRRAKRLRSPQGISRNAGEGVELLGPWDSEVQATTLGHQGSEALSRCLEDIRMHLRWAPSCFA